ncbi:ATP-binding protein [Aureimonas endophytica]|uniref:ATP-binding protein n=1 Tax=Aureimonas endophytica TaxID=2027858 RepID=A0A917E393_9HYPH|nr:GTP-binding protein [Aureimonas endophytica]GGD98817.1 ATP-binding protein [Aureimonas endophytica]
MSAAPFIPVNLLTGFLGSGKTTLLHRLLQDPALAGAAVLINEFGEVGLDHHLIERIDETTVLLQSGCVCCTIRGELSDAMRELLSRRERGLVPAFDRLVIESTGLADPFPILSTVRADPVLSHHFTLGNVVATVDAVNAADQFERRPEMAKQVAAADRIVVTKGDLVAPEAQAALGRHLSALNPAAAVVDVHDAAWDAGWLMVESAETEDHETHHDHHGGHHAHGHEDGHGHGGHHHHHGHDPNRHGETIRAFAVTLDRPLDWTGFGIWLSMLLNRHGDRILRVKGILDLVGETRPVAVHGVQHLVHPPTHMAAWPTEQRSSRLVFIVDGLSEPRIRASLAAFMALGEPAMAEGSRPALVEAR